MSVNRMRYIVYYRGRRVVKQLEKMNVNVTYISKKMNYAVFFGEEKLEKQYLSELKKVRGFNKLEKSELFDEDTNFHLDPLLNKEVVDDNKELKQ